ncbi:MULTISPECIES: pyridoxamine 5'-phosphate oxidase family protein [unclassified Ruegeria]|uniref:pyridoxamine 5'-phosphate oxidase family protein n=1 Tax=unclassified Ruegeria TaxID=2625375 RepID=UPI001ADC9432|nr:MULTISPECIES: pyridoxamine 5'-phosphate oxidase family protein [unclassified Ruegeria]MBO9411561.1 pyridoxamine 5'-phosphate oxidase family protein [Ruegeria sp. R8_1]MBO9415877.1 pyridoxamine 5'-phosphate oxidase family protein [Ruegeria sp. R8_2]
MEFIEDIETLEALYGTPAAPALRKVAHGLTPLYRRWIMASRLCILSTVGPEGTDGSPRGDEGPVVLELDPSTLALPDWRGNNRLDSLRNIVRDPRVALLFMVPGSNVVVRVNGTARLTADASLRARFEKNGKQPATVAVIAISEIYTQCARALMRARTWSAGDETDGLPTVGEILAEASDGEEGGAQYDKDWGARAAKTMW